MSAAAATRENSYGGASDATNPYDSRGENTSNYNNNNNSSNGGSLKQPRQQSQPYGVEEYYHYNNNNNNNNNNNSYNSNGSNNNSNNNNAYGSGGGAQVTPEAEDLINEVLAMNTLAMLRCQEESLDEAIGLLSEAYMKLDTLQDPPPASSSSPPRDGSGGENNNNNYNNNNNTNSSEYDEDGIPPYVIEDEQLRDKLRSTTLNNLGVVECHRGDPRQAISHFETARMLEENWNIASPALALNVCAAYNTIGSYDKATAAALETIDMLRTLEVQRRQERKQRKEERERQKQQQQQLLLENGGGGGDGTNGELDNGYDSARQRQQAPAKKLTRKQREQQQREEEEYLATAGQPRVADSENRALWGAAWNNLAIAQLNTAKQNTGGGKSSGARDRASEHSNAFVLFQNALRATQELLGRDHPMTREVTEAFRAARTTLRKNGAFQQHHTQATTRLPPVDPREQQRQLAETQRDVSNNSNSKSVARAVEKKQRDLTITFRGEATRGVKYTERVAPEAYPGAAAEPYSVHESLHPVPPHRRSLNGASASSSAGGNSSRSRSRSKKRSRSLGGSSGGSGMGYYKNSSRAAAAAVSRRKKQSPRAQRYPDAYLDSFPDADDIYNGRPEDPNSSYYKSGLGKAGRGGAAAAENADGAASKNGTMLGSRSAHGPKCSARQCYACEAEGFTQFSPDTTLDWVQDQQNRSFGGGGDDGSGGKKNNRDDNKSRQLPPIKDRAAVVEAYSGQSKFLLVAQPAEDGGEEEEEGKEEEMPPPAEVRTIPSQGNRDFGRPDYYYSVRPPSGKRSSLINRQQHPSNHSTYKTTPGAGANNNNNNADDAYRSYNSSYNNSPTAAGASTPPPPSSSAGRVVAGGGGQTALYPTEGHGAGGAPQHHYVIEHDKDDDEDTMDSYEL